MPIFTKKILNKSGSHHRLSRLNITECPKINEDLNDFDETTLNLRDVELTFKNGIWVTAAKGKLKSNQKPDEPIEDIAKLRKQLKILEEEKNMFEFKNDLLLDMLTEHVSEMTVLQNDVNEAKHKQ